MKYLRETQGTTNCSDLPQCGADLEHHCSCHGFITPRGESAGPRWGEQGYLTSAQSSLQHQACNTQLVMKDRDVIWPGWWYLPRVCVCVAGSSTQLCDNSAGSTAVFQDGVSAQDLFSPKGVIRKVQKGLVAYPPPCLQGCCLCVVTAWSPILLGPSCVCWRKQSCSQINSYCWGCSICECCSVEKALIPVVC